MIRRTLLAGWALLVAMPLPSRAQVPSSEDIVNKLAPAPLTRSIRGVTVSPGQSPERPSIDLYIPFDFDSARLLTEGTLILDRLGAALKDPLLARSRFEVAGHTDAVGTDDYNQKLSELRAKAVVDYLTRKFNIAGDRLVAVGYGRSRLRNPAKPTDGINRRVQISNLGDAGIAKP
jgi:outer membrane protein OmpA-like peptidoglycan-associated protein